MGLFDQIENAEAQFFTDPDTFGELVTYKPAHGTPRVISAVVDRQPPQRYGSDGSVITAAMEIEVANDAVKGILAEAINNGGDKISVSYRKGGTPVDHLIYGEPVSQDGGMIRLALR